MKPIGYVENDFKEKFGIPRQSGRTSLCSRIVFFPEYANPDCFRGLEDFSHIWVLFEFSKAKREKFSPTVRPPRLGGNKRVGVFASRSPFRPNPIGLSCVRLVAIERTERGVELVVSGADILDGTPVFDVKPYIPYADCQTDAVGSYADEHARDGLTVEFPERLLEKIPSEKRTGLLECLRDDPRPSYQTDGREYGMKFGKWEIKFFVENGTLTVKDVYPL